MGRDPRRWWILGVLCLCVWILVMDNTVLNLAVPVLMKDLGAGTDDIQWIVDVYPLAFAGLLLTAGALSDRYGRRLSLILGMAMFGGASMAASLATEAWQLIGMRALMGLGGAMLMPSTLSILVGVFEEDERRKAFAAWSAASVFGLVVGPLAGGFLLESYHWGTIFWINVPIAAIAVGVAIVIIPETKGPARALDPAGVLLSAAGMTALVYAIVSVPRAGWAAAEVLVAATVAACSLVAFAWWERRVDHSMLPMTLFRDRRFGGASLSVVLVVFGSGALLLVISQYLQFVRGARPIAAGVALLPYVVATVLANGVSGTLSRKIGNRMLISVGFGLAAAGFTLLALIDGVGDDALFVGGLVTMGVGAGLAGPAAYDTLMGAVPADHVGVGSALNDTVQQVGMALSVAVLGSVLAWGYSSSMPAGVPPPARESIAGALATGDAVLAAAARSAFVAGMTMTLLIGAACCVAAVAVALSVLRPPPVVASPEPGKAPNAVLRKAR
jgi:EmrB/QacA subfamily drug resistance transporter